MGGGLQLGCTLHRQSNRAWKQHSYFLHSHMGLKWPSLSRLSLHHVQKGASNVPERFSLCTAVKVERTIHLQGTFLPRCLQIGSMLSNRMGKSPLSSSFLGWQILHKQHKGPEQGEAGEVQRTGRAWGP